jgi:chromosome segregation ATPase
MTWRLKMKEQRELKKQGCSLLYHRIKLLVDIENDVDFLEECESQSVEPLDQLDNELEDVGHRYLLLKAVYNEFPKESDWKKRLELLIAEIKEKQKRKSTGERETISWKKRAEELQKENERLRRELDKMTVLVEELRRIVDREHAAA